MRRELSLAPEILLLANGVLLVLATLAALTLVRASVRYQRNVGDNRVQREHVKTIVYSVLVIIFLGIIAAGLNLFSLQL